MEIKFERNWCDYLTECPYKKGVMVGSYECTNECEHCISSSEGAKPVQEITSYIKYFEIWHGTVNCNYNKE